MKIDKKLNKPIYMQIYDNVINEIIDGYLTPEERLPSRRRLCSELGVAPQTVESAYQKLLSDGYIVSRPGSGYYVSSERVWDEEQQQMKSIVYNFSSNGVETSKLPFEAWAKLLRSTIRDDAGLFQHGEKAGEWCLRKSIRRMLFRTQNIKCRTEQIIIGPGAEDLLRDLFSLLGSDRGVIMNNYYNYRVRCAANDAKTDILYLSSDDGGINIEELKRCRSGLLYQKPIHDLPTGVTLDEEKRAEIIDWLSEGRYVIEDSAENDYQYGERAKTLWEMADGRNVIYLGSFSKTIAPSMKIGYIVVPEEIARLWFEKKRFYANRVSRVEQVTLSKFIDLGYYEKHIRYMRSIYHEKSIALKNAVYSSSLGSVAQISGDDAGMFCRASFNIDIPEKQANKLLAENGVKLSPLSTSVEDTYRAYFPENTYTVGCGEMKISQIRDGIALWARTWEKYLK